jgi:hypothetical protein
MHLTRQEFKVGAQAVLEALQVVVDGGYHHYELSHWELGYSKDDLSCLYLVHPPVVTMVTNHPQEEDDEERAKHEQQQVDDEAFALEDDSIDVDTQQYLHHEEDAVVEKNHAATTSIMAVVEWTFSIVYSDTYRVPVLYFHVHQMKNGEPCLRSRVSQQLQPASSVVDPWEFVSQEEHPITGFPSFFLYPCQTSERLELLQHLLVEPSISTTTTTTTTGDEGKKSTTTVLLWTWMSMILPVVKHPIPSTYFLQIQTQILQAKRKEEEKTRDDSPT